MSMTPGKDDQTLPVSTVGQASDQRCNKITYTREFLLSFSELEICKQPPRGFDPSIINESQEVAPSAPEWRRSIGFSAAQNPKRSDNGLAAWVENANNAARGSYDKTSHSHGSGLIHGKWDSRSVSSVSSDNDGDQHSDRGSENNRYGGQPRRSWQPPEHDGLLGSGGFPRPSVHAGGPLNRGNSQYPPNRSSEPYQPPRAFKPSVHPRRDPTDICNDETFGSLECSSEEKTEEEKRRKESFELMRKEQLKELQERQNQRQQLKQNIDRSESLENMEDDKVQSQSSRADDCDPILSQNDCAKSSLPQSSSRPSVPPGFRNSTSDKSSNSKAPTSLVVSESMETTVHDDAVGTGGSFLLDDPADGQVKKRAVLLSGSDLTSSEVASLATDGAKKPISALSGSSEQVDQVVHNGNSRIMDTEEEINSKMQGSVTPEPSILDKLFGSAMSIGSTGLPSFSEPPVEKPEEERWHPVNHSSKFASWFIEEEKKPTSEVPESKAGGLLSLLVNNEKPSPPHVSEFSEKELYGGGSLFPLDSHKSLQTASVHFQKKDVQDEQSKVLTCEDLEQFIIAEANSGQSSAEVRLHNLLDIRGGARNVNNNASSHILSLLQKGNGELDVSPQRYNMELLPDEQTGPVEVVRHPEKTLTLEALFGSAFMEELQSVEAPVSAQRGPVGGVVRTGSGSVAPNLLSDVASTTPNGYSDSFFGKSSGSESLGEVINGNVVGFDDSKYATTSMVANGIALEDVRIEHAPSDIQLPEEDSLMMISGQRTMEDLRFASPPRVVRNVDTFVESTPTFDFVDKIAILNLGHKEHRPGMHGLSRHPSQDAGRNSLLALESELHKQQQHMFNGQQPSVHHFHMNQPRPPPPFVHLEQDMIRNQQQQLRLMRPENTGFDPRHQFPAEMLHHLFNQNIGPGTRFDGVPHPMLQNMIPNNFPGTHSGMLLPGGAPFPSHRSGAGSYDNRMPPFMPEQNQIHGLHLQPRPLNYNRMGMPMQGIGPMGVGGHAELERLMEMELRANANKKHPVANNPALYGPEVEMGFRYR